MYQIHIFQIIRNMMLFVMSFAVSIAAAPVLINFLYRIKAWKKRAREETFGGHKTPIFAKFHGVKETTTPRMGGVLIWGTVLVIILVTVVFSPISPDTLSARLNFISRSQTYLPIFTLIAASILGLVDDILIIREKGPSYIGGGIRLKVRMALIFLIAAAGAWWFHYKLGWDTLYIPFVGNIFIDGLYILLFIIVVIATYSSSVVDGLDGLSAGVLIPIFLSYSVISYTKGLYDLVAFITVIIGALITYLWFNVHPARFYMGETGIMGLTVTLAVIAFLTNTVLLLPVIAFVLVIESGSVILQLIWKKFKGRKLFQSAPIHHHFQAVGWPESQITMRFWIVSSVFSVLGLIIFFLARFF